MSEIRPVAPGGYGDLLAELKQRIQNAQCSYLRTGRAGVTMLENAALLFVIVSGSTLASDTAGSIRRQEASLATALSTRNEVALAALVDKDFTIHWTYQSLEQSVDTTESREDWLDRIRHMQVRSYDQSIYRLQLPNPNQAIVMLDEHWTISLASGRRIEKHFRTTDFWFRLQGTWKLTGRDCATRAGRE